jgi:small subunit ribosomal protein S4
VRERSKSLEVVTNSLSIQGAKKYNWLEWDESEMTGKIINLLLAQIFPKTSMNS